MPTDSTRSQQSRSADITPAVRFDDVTLAHGRRTLLDRANFALAPGQFIGLFGANGAGKTTLLRAMLGLLHPRSGRIEIYGVGARPGMAATGVLPQQRQWPAATLDLAAITLLEAAHPGQRTAIEQALALAEARSLAQKRLGLLSGGERQRVLLAQAMVGAPRLLLLDEPLAGLDPRAQMEAIALIDHIRRSLGATVVFSAHDLNPLLPVIDAALWLADGRVHLGSPAELLRPATLRQLYGVPMQVVEADARTLVAPALAAMPPC